MKSLRAIFVPIAVIGLIVVTVLSGTWSQGVVPLIREVAGVDASSEVDRHAQAVAELGDLTFAEAIDQLSGIAAPAVERIPKYDRDAFGSGWASDSDGCSTRERVLMRDLTDVTMRDDRACKVHTGELSPDPYTRKLVPFDSVSDPQAVQIDHVVPLSVAWKMGAHAWTDEQRKAFSNDMQNLVAADGPANSSKGDKTPDKWLPAPVDSQCSYATTYTEVSVKYRLDMSPATREALAEVLSTC